MSKLIEGIKEAAKATIKAIWPKHRGIVLPVRLEEVHFADELPKNYNGDGLVVVDRYSDCVAEMSANQRKLMTPEVFKYISLQSHCAFLAKQIELMRKDMKERGVWGLKHDIAFCETGILTHFKVGGELVEARAFPVPERRWKIVM